ncbi:MAG: hypothetical protein JXB50_08135 [Spirochaetes bacterium]|nr:hypothetical protein [Spirochaetota bacterium]
MYKTLPQTGMIGLGIFGLSNQNSLIVGLSLIVIGFFGYRMIKFKMKDSK